MDAEQRAGQIKEWAMAAGFDRVGIAGLRAAEHGQAFMAWLATGNQAGMSYLEKRTELRLDPASILDGAVSVVCVALQYHPLVGDRPSAGDLWRRVARYAHGVDYHDLMYRRLEVVAARIEQSFPGVGTKIHVDTGPVLERELAARSGIGAFGKNTNLLDAEIGSWMLLGEIFTTLELVEDPAVRDLCGSCTECLDACPTQALLEPYVLDSRRCISYWTIEHRGEIPVEVRPDLGGWVFGCDICQEVCPVNSGVPARDHPELRLPESRAALDLEALLRLEPAVYVEKFRGSAMKRAKLVGLQRNAAIAMGNSGSRSHLRALRDALDHAEPLVRLHAAWALGQIGGDDARSALREAMVQELEPGVRVEIAAALARPQE